YGGWRRYVPTERDTDRGCGAPADSAGRRLQARAAGVAREPGAHRSPTGADRDEAVRHHGAAYPVGSAYDLQLEAHGPARHPARRATAAHRGDGPAAIPADALAVCADAERGYPAAHPADAGRRAAGQAGDFTGMNACIG